MYVLSYKTYLCQDNLDYLWLSNKMLTGFVIVAHFIVLASSLSLAT